MSFFRKKLLVFLFSLWPIFLISDSNDLFNKLVEGLNSDVKKDPYYLKRKILKVNFLLKNNDNHYNLFSSDEQKVLLKLYKKRIPQKFTLTGLNKIFTEYFILAGYWKCIVSSVINPTREINIIIELGKKYKVSSIDVESLSFKKTLQSFFSNQCSERNCYDISRLENYRNKALFFLRRKGFWNSCINFESEEKTSESGEILLFVKVFVYLGPRAKFGKVEFIGNNCISKVLMLKQISFSEGDFWDSNLLYKAKSNLESLGAFENVQIICGDLINKPLEYNKEDILKNSLSVPVLIEVKERLHNEIKLQLGICLEGSVKDVVKSEFLRTLTFKAGVCYSKKNLLFLHDEANLFLDGDFAKKSIRSEYVYGKFKNFPLEITTTAFFELQSPTELRGKEFYEGLFHLNPEVKIGSNLKPEDTSDKKRHKLKHNISSFSCSLSKKTNSGSSVGLMMGCLESSFKDEFKDYDSSERNYKYFIIEPHACYVSMSGNWLNENGIVITASNKFLSSIDNQNNSLGRFQLFSHFFSPLNNTFSFAGKIGVVLRYPFGKNDSIEKYESANDLYFSEYFSKVDNFLINGISQGINQKNYLDSSLVKDILNMDKKSFYAAFELRKLITNYAGAALFFNFKIPETKKIQVLAGAGLRCNAPLGGLLLDFGWDLVDKKAYWRFCMSDTF